MNSGSHPTASYQCDLCRSFRRFTFNDDDHQGLVRTSKSGLVTYSDIHTCRDKRLSVNNLSIDKDYNIRSYEQLKLPEIRIFTAGVPAPTNDQIDQKIIHLTQLPENLELHMILRNRMLGVDIKIGRFDQQGMIPIAVLEADMGLLEMEVYPTSIAYTLELEQWFMELVRILEVLPPTSIGLLIETFRYIIENKQRKPTKYDLKFMKTILASHEVYFFLANPEGTEDLESKYRNAFGAEQLIHLERFIRILEENSKSSIKDFANNERVDMDLISLIYLFHILEDEGIITMEIPGIIAE